MINGKIFLKLTTKLTLRQRKGYRVRWKEVTKAGWQCEQAGQKHMPQSSSPSTGWGWRVRWCWSQSWCQLRIHPSLQQSGSLWSHLRTQTASYRGGELPRHRQHRVEIMGSPTLSHRMTSFRVNRTHITPSFTLTGLVVDLSSHTQTVTFNHQPTINRQIPEPVPDAVRA